MVQLWYVDKPLEIEMSAIRNQGKDHHRQLEGWEEKDPTQHPVYCKTLSILGT